MKLGASGQKLQEQPVRQRPQTTSSQVQGKVTALIKCANLNNNYKNNRNVSHYYPVFLEILFSLEITKMYVVININN